MKYKAVFIIIINVLLLLTLSNVKPYDYFGIYFGIENPQMLFFTLADKDSVTKTCFLTSPELGINNLEAKNFNLTDENFYFSIYSDKYEVDIQTGKQFGSYSGGSKIDGFVGGSAIYKFDNGTLRDLEKYCGTYYSIDKKDSIVIQLNDSLSLKTIHKNQKIAKAELNTLFPNNPELFIAKTGLRHEFKLQNFIPWQIMYIFEGQEYFFYKEL